MSTATRQPTARLHMLGIEDAGVVNGACGIAIPYGWRVVDEQPNGMRLLHPYRRQTIIVSARRERDGRRWLHASIASPDGEIGYDDLCYLHRHVLGAHRKAVQVFAPESEHVNLHKACLHLFACLDEDPLPDFREFNPALGQMEI